MHVTYKGIQARIRVENNLAIYLHCNTHVVNVCLDDLTKQIPCVQNIFGTLRILYSFVGVLSKRFDIFEQILSFVEGHNTRSII